MKRLKALLARVRAYLKEVLDAQVDLPMEWWK